MQQFRRMKRLSNGQTRIRKAGDTRFRGFVIAIYCKPGVRVCFQFIFKTKYIYDPQVRMDKTTIQSLPQEILSEIVEYISIASVRPQQQLALLARTCRCLYAASARLLYSGIDLRLDWVNIDGVISDGHPSFLSHRDLVK